MRWDTNPMPQAIKVSIYFISTPSRLPRPYFLPLYINVTLCPYEYDSKDALI